MSAILNKEIGIILKDVFKGSKGSGNFGHAGRGGKVGGSSSITTVNPQDSTWANKVPNFNVSVNDYNKVSISTVNDLDDKDQSILNGYKMADYDVINRGLRSGNFYDEVYKDNVKELDKLIDKSILNENTIAYRGLTDSGKKRIGNANVFEDKGFVSASMSPNVASSFSNKKGDLLEIYIPKGKNILPIDKFTSADLGEFNEREFVLPHGSKFKVLGKRKETLWGKLNNEASKKVSIVMVQLM